MGDIITARPHTEDVGAAFWGWLDAIRWAAALAVVCTHVNNRFFTKYLLLSPENRHFIHLIISLISGFGHQAVVAFFVISGLLVGGSLWSENIRLGRIDVSAYLLKRLVRLWTVLIPALLLVAVADSVGRDFFHGGLVYGADDVEDIGSEIGVRAFLCNVVFLQDAFCYQYGSDSALWSLYNEFWYYIIWPFLLIALFSKQNVFVRVTSFCVSATLLIGLTMFQFVGAPLGPYMAIWLLGVVAATRTRPLVRLGRNQSVMLLLIFMISFRLAVPTAWMDRIPYAWFVADLALSLLLTNALLCARLDRTLPPAPFRSANQRLASFSFSLYCVHTPIINLYVAVLMFYFGVGWKMIPSSCASVILGASGVAISLAGGFLFSLGTESHTYKLRKIFLGALEGYRRRTLAPNSA